MATKIKTPAAESAPTVAPSHATRTTLLAGVDLGTNKTCVKACIEGQSEIAIQTLTPTVVGYADLDVIEGILPGNASLLFGEDALRYRMHLRLVQPVSDGNVADVTAMRDFMLHLRSKLDPTDQADIRAVIGMPANASQEAREMLRESTKGIFSKVIFIPEPFLAALGVREESKIGTPTYQDPVQHSLFVDIGAGTTDLCMIQGYFPAPDDQISFPFAGNAVDQILADSIARLYPDTDLSMLKVREIKETHSYAGKIQSGIPCKVYVRGKPRTIEVGELVGQACNQLVARIFNSIRELVSRAPSDAVENLLQNIIVTGGGSKIRGLAPELERLLADEGYENPKVSVAGPNYKEYVALGALKAARSARPNQWQHLL
jgi:rod shape-determining protein MreB